MAIFDYKTRNILTFLTQTCPPTEVAAIYIYIYIYIQKGGFQIYIYIYIWPRF